MKFVTIVLGGLLLCAAGLRADPLPGEFFIDLNSPLGCVPVNSYDTSCVSNWGANRTFNVQVNPTGDNALTASDFTGENPEFINSAFCSSGSEEEESGGCNTDPDMDIDLGGFSPPFLPSFNSNECSNGICDFINETGQHFSSLIITTQLTGTPLDGDIFSCSGADAFQFCGFSLDSDGNLEIAFLQGDKAGIDSAAVPESALWIPLAGLAGLVVLANRRKLARQRG